MDESSKSDIHRKLLENNYHELKVKSQNTKKYYKKVLQELEESKTRALEELKGYYEAKLQEKASQLQLSQEESSKNLREFEKTIKQLEEDGNLKMQDMKVKFDQRLREERKTSLCLMAEYESMRKKFSSLQEDMEESKMDIVRMKLEEQNWKQRIQFREKDIQDQKNEIQERDKTILEKNQELEKIKHVADYKIQDLKKEIEQRDKELKEMKEKIQGMEGELELIHNQSSQLEFHISQLRQKLKAANQEMLKERQKAGVVGADVDIREEYARQREHLQRGVSAPQEQLNNERETQREGSVQVMQVMQENVTLIKETNELRQELKIRRTNVQNLEAVWHRSKTNGQILSADSTGSRSAARKSSGVLRLNREVTKLPQIQIKEFRDLKQAAKIPPCSVPSRVVKLPALGKTR